MTELSAEERKKRLDNCSARMGTLLLQGWAMLEQVCPDCDVPIMRSRKKEEICCSCDTAYQTKTVATTAGPTNTESQINSSSTPAQAQE